MTNRGLKDPRPAISRLANNLISVVDTLSDDQIMREAKEDGLDSDLLAKEFESSALSLVANARKKILAEAKAGYISSNSSKVWATKKRPSIDEMKNRIQLLFQTQPQLAVAFRDGKSISNNDWESLWDDLADMGLVSDDE